MKDGERGYHRVTMCDNERGWINLGLSFSSSSVRVEERKEIQKEMTKVKDGFAHLLTQDEFFIGLNSPLV